LVDLDDGEGIFGELCICCIYLSLRLKKQENYEKDVGRCTAAPSGMTKHCYVVLL